MNTIFDATFVGHWFVDVLSANCSRENVSGKMFVGKRSVRFAHTSHAIKLGQYLTKVIANVLVWTCSVRFAHTAHASLMGAYAPKRSANRALSEEG